MTEALPRPQLIQQVRVLDAVTNTDQVADVLVQAGQVAAIASYFPDLPADTEILPSQGKVLIPGLVDLYSHSGEPGHEDRETLASLLKAGQAGGLPGWGFCRPRHPPLTIRRWSRSC